jgi:hypothetical protein
MTDLLKAVVITSLEGVNLTKLTKKPPKKSKTGKAGVGVRTKYYQEERTKADSYIRFLIDKETKERFKLFCHLKGTTMSDFLREAVEDILNQNLSVAPTTPKVRQLPVATQSGVDIGQMWNQAFGDLCA